VFVRNGQVFGSVLRNSAELNAVESDTPDEEKTAVKKAPAKKVAAKAPEPAKSGEAKVETPAPSTPEPKPATAPVLKSALNTKG